MKLLHNNLSSNVTSPQVIAANDITAVFLTLPLIFYLNKKNKAFWCGLGQLVAALANLLPLVALLLVPGSYVTTDILTPGAGAELCRGQNVTHQEEEQGENTRDWGKLMALGCFFLCKLCSGKNDLFFEFSDLLV